jgi:hypothetical protein
VETELGYCALAQALGWIKDEVLTFSTRGDKMCFSTANIAVSCSSPYGARSVGMADQHKNEQGVGYLMVWILGLALVFTLVLAFAPQIFGRKTDQKKSPDSVNLGAVRRVSFIGGFIVSTQVETDQEVVLLRGANGIAVGTALERRKVFGGDYEVCEAKGDRCWLLLSR